MRVRLALFGSATLHLLLMSLASLSPRVPRRFASLTSASFDYFLFACGGHGLTWFACCLYFDFLFIRLQRAWSKFTTGSNKQGQAGFATPLFFPLVCVRL
jgi:hypothetical protein